MVIKMVKKKFDVWYFLVWVALGYILLWLILKITGVINTPLWLTYSPVFGAIYAVGWYAKKVEEASVKLNSISNEFGKFRSDTVQKIHNIDLNCARNHK